MPTLTTRFTFDILEGDALFEVFVDSVKVTEWHFEDGPSGIVTCPAKGEASVPFEEAEKALNDMDEWIKFIRNHGSYYQCNNAAKEDYTTELQRDDDGIEASFVIGSTEYRGSSWAASTDLVTYAARPAITNWSWGTFLAWHRLGDEFFRMIKDHKATE